MGLSPRASIGEIRGRVGSIAVTDDAPTRIRAGLGLRPDEPIRIGYITGPGDVVGTFGQWKQGQTDPRVPVLTYSGMLYDLVETLGASLRVCHQIPADSLPSTDGLDIEFIHTPLQGEVRSYLAYQRTKAEHAARCIMALRGFDPHFTIISADVSWPTLPLIKGRKILSVHNAYWPADQVTPRNRREQVEALGMAAVARSSVGGAVCTSTVCEDQLARLASGAFPIMHETPQYPRDPGMKSRTEVGKPLRLLFVGRMTRSKGIDDLYQAARQLRQEGIELSLTYVGDGIVDEFRQQISDAGDADWVDVRGRLPAEKVYGVMREADLLVCPTRREFLEGLALVCIEALGVGTPSIMSTMVPAAGLVGPAGLTYPANDAGALREQIRRFATDAELRQAMCDAAVEGRSRFMDRSLSWGSCMVNVMQALAERRA